MYEYCLGIRPSEEGGFRRVTLAPVFDPDGRITFAEGHYDTPYGRIAVSWQRTDDGFSYQATVPKEIALTVDFGSRTLLRQETENGRYRFLLR